MPPAIPVHVSWSAVPRLSIVATALSRAWGITWSGMLGLDHSSFTLAPPVFWKYSSVIGVATPARSAIRPLTVVAA